MKSSRNSVFMVMSGSLQNGVPKVVTFVNSQAQALQDAGWVVHLGVVDNRTSPQGILRNIKRLRREIAETRPSIVHAQYGSITAAVANAVRGNLPLVISFCGDDLLGTPSAGLKWRLRGKAARVIGILAAYKAAAIIVKSKNLLDALPRRLSSRATILPNGVNTEFFTPMDLQHCRGQLGWPMDSRIVLFNASHGSNSDSKNPELAGMAIERVSDRVSGVIMKTMSQNTKEEVRLMLNAADCLVVTSIHEGSPNIVKESMACNLPVVSVNCGDVSERLRSINPGEVCYHYDAEELGLALSKVLTNPVRSNGRVQLTSQGLRSQDVAGRLMNIYSTLVK